MMLRMTACWLTVFCAAVPLAELTGRAEAQTTTRAGSRPGARVGSSPLRWEAAIRAYEQQDAEHRPAAGGVLFVGSSSIRLWDVKKSFPDLPVLNRGFGGSMYSEVAWYADRIILPYRPRVIVLYTGDNDIAFGKNPGQVFADFQTLIRKVRRALPDAKIIVLSAKLCDSRWALRDKVREFNALVRDFAKGDPKMVFVDAATPLLGPDGRPRPELFMKDRLHLNAKGYEIWTALLRPLLESDPSK
jgi:lysophospholipase L1-like esterase